MVDLIVLLENIVNLWYNMDYQKIKEGLGIEDNSRISVSKVSGGYNIRIRENKPLKSRPKFNILHERCLRCGDGLHIHPHHIIPRSAGGGDEVDNIIPLCFKCHVGDEGIHNNKWKIEELIPLSHIMDLKRRYKIIK